MILNIEKNCYHVLFNQKISARDPSYDKLEEMKRLVKDNNIDFAITIYDTHFGKYVFQHFDQFVNFEHQNFLQIFGESAPTTSRSDSQVIKLFSGADLTLEFMNSFPSDRNSDENASNALQNADSSLRNSLHFFI